MNSSCSISAFGYGPNHIPWTIRKSNLSFQTTVIYNELLDVIRILRLIFRYISFVVRRKFVRQSKQLLKVCQSLSLESLIRKSIFGSLMTWPRSFRLGWTFCSVVPLAREYLALLPEKQHHQQKQHNNEMI